MSVIYDLKNKIYNMS